MKKSTLVYAVIVAVMGIWALDGFIKANADNTQSRSAYVQHTCDDARNELSARSEKACGDAQDSANAEYLCNAAGNQCWVELK